MVDAKTVREVATKYLYDRCVAVAAIGQLLYLSEIVVVIFIGAA